MADTHEYQRLLAKARRWGVEIPDPNEKPTWYDHSRNLGFDFTGTIYPLSETGMSGVSKLIREERRKTIEWWVKIVASLMVTLTGLLGTLIGVLALLKK